MANRKADIGSTVIIRDTDPNLAGAEGVIDRIERDTEGLVYRIRFNTITKGMHYWWAYRHGFSVTGSYNQREEA